MAQHRSLLAPGADDLQQTAVRRVDLKQQPVVYRQLGRPQAAVGAEAQHRIVAVHMLIDQDSRELCRAGVAITAADRLESQVRERISGDAAACRLQLAPGDGAVAFGVEAEHEVQIAQRDVPLALEDFAGCGHGEGEIGVARLVGGRRRAPGAEQDREHAREPRIATPPHGVSTGLAQPMSAQSVRSS